MAKQILKFADDLTNLSNLISQIDCFHSMFLTSIQFNMVKPIFSNKTKIKAGRNLISEIIFEEYKALNFDYSNNVITIFGSNSTGKTNLLKLIGQINFLAQIGSFVPADYYETQIFDQILSEININESLITGLSGFSKELNCLNYIDNSINLDSNSLVLLDDPYKRTSEINKFCLFYGTLEKYLVKSNNLIIVSSNSNILELGIKMIPNIIPILKNFECILLDKSFKLNFMTTLLNSNEIDKLEIIKDIISDSKDILLSAKENGLNTEIYLKANEYLDLLKSKNKVEIPLGRVVMTISKLKNSMYELKNSSCVKEILSKLTNS